MPVSVIHCPGNGPFSILLLGERPFFPNMTQQVLTCFWFCLTQKTTPNNPPNPKTLVHLRLMKKIKLLWTMLEMVWNPREHFVVTFANMTRKCSHKFHTISNIVQGNFIFFISLKCTKVVGFGGLMTTRHAHIASMQVSCTWHTKQKVG